MIYDYNGNPISGNVKSVNQGAISLMPFKSDDLQSLISSFEDVISAYDSLVSSYPQYVTKNTLTQGSFTNYEYVFTSGNYNSYASHAYAMDAEIAKPKFLITAGIHGHEKSAVMGAYVFCKAMCEGVEGLSYLREGFEFHVIPVANPNGYNANKRQNLNNVDLNRNFNASWVSGSTGYYYPGASAASEDETKIIQSWLDSNSDAKALIDFHNSEVVKEICLIQSIGVAEDVTELKQSALYAANQIIPHWKIDREFPTDTTLFFYTGKDTTGHGYLSMYARDKGIPSCIMETSWNMKSTGQHSNFTIGTNSEALAIVIIGMCSQIES